MVNFGTVLVLLKFQSFAAIFVGLKLEVMISRTVCTLTGGCSHAWVHRASIKLKMEI